MSGTRDDVIIDERLDSLERWRDVDYRQWQADIERRFAEAFSGADHVGHCRYHDLIIKQIEERRQLRIAIQTKAIAGLVWAGIAFVGIAAWHYVRELLRL